MKSCNYFLGIVSLLCCVAVFSPFCGIAQQNDDDMKRYAYDPQRSSFILTVNWECPTMWSYQPTGLKVFDKDNMAFGLKIGSVKRAGWYLSFMSNFNFKGAFNTIDSRYVNYNVSRYTYIEGMVGVIARHCKPLSFHFGVGGFYNPHNYQNYKEYGGEWGHFSNEAYFGPVLATGFMFHIGHFLLSAEALAKANLKATSVPNAFSVGLKVGIGFSAGGDKKAKKSQYTAQEDFFPKPFTPKTAVPNGVSPTEDYSRPLNLPVSLDSLLSTTKSIDSLVIILYPSKNTQSTAKSAQQPQQETPVVNTPTVTVKTQIVEEEEPPTPAKVENPDIMALPVDGEPVPEPKSEPEPNVVAEEPVAEPAPEPEIIPVPVPVPEPERPCGELVVKDWDGNEYHTLELGSQCWLKENLKSAHYADGQTIPLGNQGDVSADAPLRYYPGGQTVLAADYGYLYNWIAVMHGEPGQQTAAQGPQGVCPDGWHVPSRNEWNTLLDYVIGQPQYSCGVEGNVSKALSASVAWRAAEEPCTPGNEMGSNNLTGFSVMPSGYYKEFKSGYKAGAIERAFFVWSATSGAPGNACSIDIVFNAPDVEVSCDSPVELGYSVRCVKNSK